MVSEDYVSFEIAKLLKEKGFDEPCNNRYYETHFGFDLGLDPGYTNSHWEDWYKNMGVRNYSAPTLQMAMKWLREVHNLHIDVDPSEGNWNPTVLELENWACAVKFGDKIPIQDSYEEACEVAIKYCLTNLI